MYIYKQYRTERLTVYFITASAFSWIWTTIRYW